MCMHTFLYESLLCRSHPNLCECVEGAYKAVMKKPLCKGHLRIMNKRAYPNGVRYSEVPLYPPNKEFAGMFVMGFRNKLDTEPVHSVTKDKLRGELCCYAKEQS